MSMIFLVIDIFFPPKNVGLRGMSARALSVIQCVVTREPCYQRATVSLAPGPSVSYCYAAGWWLIFVYIVPYYENKTQH